MNFSELPTGMTVLIAIALAVGAVAHWRIQRFWLASFVSGIATVLVFYVVCLIQAGFPEPKGIAPFVLFGVFGFIVAALVGLAAKVLRSANVRRA